MTSGKWHARIGVTTCLAVWAVTCLVSWDFKPSGLVITIIFGALFAKFPDMDLDFDLGQGHRNDLMHSGIIPIMCMVLLWVPLMVIRPEFVGVAWEKRLVFNYAVQMPAYFCIAVSSHLFADLGGAKSHLGHWWWGVNAVVAWIAGVTAIVILVV